MRGDLRPNLTQGFRPRNVAWWDVYLPAARQRIAGLLAARRSRARPDEAFSDLVFSLLGPRQDAGLKSAEKHGSLAVFERYFVRDSSRPEGGRA